MTRTFVLTDEQIRTLPLDVLGLEILKDVVDNQETNSRNWLLQANQTYGESPLAVLNEAWDWLQANGLVALNRLKNGEHFIMVTRLGEEVARTADLERLRAAARVNLDLHPLLTSKVRPQFLMGEYEMAAFAAMKAVEVRVREMAGAPDSLIGVKLMRTAFGDGGALCDTALDAGEQQARRELFCGAIGTVKNPTSHRDVCYDDPTEASEAVLLADLLMRVLDRIEPAK